MKKNYVGYNSMYIKVEMKVYMGRIMLTPGKLWGSFIGQGFIRIQSNSGGDGYGHYLNLGDKCKSV